VAEIEKSWRSFTCDLGKYSEEEEKESSVQVVDRFG